MPNFTTNTAIVNRSWNARGLITHRGTTRALIRADDGTLWAAVREGNVKRYINIYRSNDGGFSWQNMFAGDFLNTNRRTGISGLNQNGPFIQLTLSEERNRLILWHAFYNGTNSQYEIEPYIFDISGGTLVRKTEAADYAVTGIGLNMDGLAFDTSYTDTHIYHTFTSFSTLNVNTYHHTYQVSVDGLGTFGSGYFNIFSTHANLNNTLDIAILKDNTPNYTLQYIRWQRITNIWSTPVVIADFPAADLSDLVLEKDGNGNLLAFWSQENAAGNDLTLQYATSTDNGATWINAEIPFTSNQTNYTDVATNRLAGRTVALGGLQGFLLAYVRDYNGTPTAFMRTLLEEGGNYTLGEEKIIVDHPCTGVRFFRPTGNQLLDLNQLGQIRIAYQIGEATSQIQVDSDPVVFGQQLLREAAAFAEPEMSYSQDTPEQNQVLVNFNLLNAPSENIDYYGEGLIGPITNKYIAAFEKAGISLNLYRYEPNPLAEASDRSAYGDPTVHSAHVVFQAVNYDFPMVMSSESYTTYVERDTRKMHLTPAFHLDRTFLVNNGNHLKRTVWIVRYDGNEYELSQVVPKFLRNQVLYYSVNAYVVGPSNDPFSRVILPSET